MQYRRLGRSNLQVSALGMGCWAMGGPWSLDGEQVGWGKVDDSESIRAIHFALDAGVNFFDTAANYGAGHSERLLGKALAGRRDKVVIASKFGYVVDETQRKVSTTEAVPGRIRQECEASLQRLGCDHIDLYQFHKNDYNSEKAPEVCDILERLEHEGKIRWYGWSTDHAEGARIFAKGTHCSAIQHILNMAMDAPEVLNVCQEFDLASVNRSPLGMGTLTGKFSHDSTFPEDDVRHDWDFHGEQPTRQLNRVEAVKEYFASQGDARTPAQIALAWIWSRSEKAIPIPGFKTLAQVQENIAALDCEALSKEQMERIEEIYGR